MRRQLQCVWPFGFDLQRRIENRLDPVRTIRRFASAPRGDFPQTLQPLCSETLSPQADGLAIALQCGCHSRVRFPTGHGHYNAAPQRDLLRSAHRCQPLPDLILLILRKRKRRRPTRHASLSTHKDCMSGYLLDTTLGVSERPSNELEVLARID